MIYVEVPQLKRSYDRNVSWCRFWLGISLAVATLTFTFGVNQVFDPLFEGAPTRADERGDLNDNGQTDSFTFTGVAVMIALFLIASVCASLAAVFRVLYQRDNVILSAIEHTYQEEAP